MGKSRRVISFDILHISTKVGRFSREDNFVRNQKMNSSEALNKDLCIVFSFFTRQSRYGVSEIPLTYQFRKHRFDEKRSNKKTKEFSTLSLAPSEMENDFFFSHDSGWKEWIPHFVSIQKESCEFLLLNRQKSRGPYQSQKECCPRVHHHPYTKELSFLIENILWKTKNYLKKRIVFFEYTFCLKLERLMFFLRFWINTTNHGRFAGRTQISQCFAFLVFPKNRISFREGVFLRNRSVSKHRQRYIQKERGWRSFSYSC